MAETVLRIGRRIDSIQESEDPPPQEEPPQEEPQAEEKQAPRTPTSQIRRLDTPRSPTTDESKFAVESSPPGRTCPYVLPPSYYASLEP